MRCVAFLFAFFCAFNAWAGLFDDQEARRLANEAKKEAENRFAQQTDSLLEFSNQLQEQADELAKLRGQVESLRYELEQAKKRQQDLYLDLDARLRRFEGTPETNTPSPSAPSPSPSLGGGGETALYDSSLEAFKAERYAKAAEGFQKFVRQFPNSAQSAKAHYWLGTSFYAQGQCAKAIAAHQVVIERYADSTEAPEAWLAIALCQQELGNMGSAKRSLQELSKRYPKTPAAQTAQERLKTLRQND